MRKSREKKNEASLEAILAKYLHIDESLPPIPELSEEHLAIVESVWSRGRDKIISEIAGEECKKSDLATLRGELDPLGAKVKRRIFRHAMVERLGHQLLLQPDDATRRGRQRTSASLLLQDILLPQSETKRAQRRQALDEESRHLRDGQTALSDSSRCSLDDCSGSHEGEEGDLLGLHGRIERRMQRAHSRVS